MSTVTSKGQVVIPSKIRKKMGIKTGTRVLIEEEDGKIIIHPANKAFYEQVFGMFKGKDLLKTLKEERKKEAIKERAKIAKFKKHS